MLPTDLPRALVTSAQGQILAISPAYATGTISITRTSSATYVDESGLVQTAGTNVLRNDHWVGGVRTILTEPAATNVVLWNRDLTNAAWVATDVTPLKDQVGSDGVANAASSITATAPNGTILQSITLASSSRRSAVRVKRLVGAGTIEFTQDGGSTWTPITVTAAYTRVSLSAQTIVNPQVGFRIATSGDSIAVDFVQNETGPYVTSDIATTAASVTRSADAAFLADARLNPPRALTMYYRAVNIGQFNNVATIRRMLHVGTSNIGNDPRLTTLMGSGVQTLAASYDDGVTPQTATATPSPLPATGDTVEQRIALSASWTVTSGVSVNRGTEVSATSLASASSAAWAAAQIHLSGSLSSDNCPMAYERILVVEGVRTMADMRQMAGA